MLRRVALLPFALLLASPALADRGELGIDAVALHLGGDVEPAARLRGGWFIPDSWVEIEGQVTRTFGDVALTTVMAGPSLNIPIELCCGGDDETWSWTLSALAGAGKADTPQGAASGLAWQAGAGVKWHFEDVNLRLEGGWQGAQFGDADASGPMLDFGVAFRFGD